MAKKDFSKKDKLTNRYLIQFAYDVVWAILIMIVLKSIQNSSFIELGVGIERYGAVIFAVVGAAFLIAWAKAQKPVLCDSGLNFIGASLGCLYLRYYAKIIGGIFGTKSFLLKGMNMEFRTLYCILAVVIIIQTIIYLINAKKLEDAQ